MQSASSRAFRHYPGDHGFESLHIMYDGMNGQLPSFDLIIAVRIASGQMSVRAALQEMWNNEDGETDRLRAMLRGMANQGLGQGSGSHSSFLPYYVDAYGGG